MGQEAITVVDTNSFVAMGQKILNSSNLVDNFTNELVLRITRSIISFRRYQSQYRINVYTDSRWGAIVQKLKVEMPEASEDEAYDLVEGQSVDMYKVSKPRIHQKFFVNRTPYNFKVTLQLWQLEEAFTSPEAFNSLVSAIYGEVQNKLELTFENLGRMTVNNFIGNVLGTGQEIHVLTLYNAENGTSLSWNEALNNPDFLRHTVATMNEYSRAMEMMSTLYNSEGFTRHTPKPYQRLATIARYQEKMATIVQYAAFHEQFVRSDASMVLPYWQAPSNPFAIDVTKQDGTESKSDLVLACLYDRDALGTYRKEQKVATTPLNAAGLYTNTFWHERQMWFNDQSENFLVFTLT